MTRTIEVTLYKFDELPTESAKEKAREWFRQGNAGDNHFAESITDMAANAASLLGIVIDGWNWSGFCSQGDGAAFRGSYRYAKGSALAIRQAFPQDEKLRRIADDLQKAQRRAFYRLTATCETTRGNNMRVNVEDSERYGLVTRSDEDAIEEALTDFAHWFYRALETEYDFINSNDEVDSTIRLNEYEFEEDGARA